MKKNLLKRNKNFRKGDIVIAIAGNEKGRTGAIQSVKGERLVVQGLNMRKKHIKKTQENPKGRIVEIERGIHVSNIKHYVETAS